jgi:hypothetical protein
MVLQGKVSVASPSDQSAAAGCGVTGVFHGCLLGVAGMLQGYYTGVNKKGQHAVLTSTVTTPQMRVSGS